MVINTKETMENYDFKLSRIYDKIFQDKDYYAETLFLQDAFSRYSKIKLEKILDIGCGTGRHSSEIAKLGYQVTGVDPSSYMIQIARDNNKGISNCEFIEGNLIDVKGKYQLAVSMFNVVNHIMSLDELILFFEAVRCVLDDGGLFIFDCFNGAATSIDPPRNRSIEKKLSSNKRIFVNTVCETSLMESRLTMQNTVEYEGEHFSFNLEHRLWSPMILDELLRKANFRLHKVVKTFNVDVDASISDYKIAFICDTK